MKSYLANRLRCLFSYKIMKGTPKVETKYGKKTFYMKNKSGFL